ncbi:ATP-binding cassette domain-containing protein [Actinopolymorpha sp. B11F2]|uniref:ABC transporter ATP-binding protein n=1 Tax=Actinopolymorpha sp. B11F2 TaxID=3160862 RepID=UPI0032E4979E
MAFLKVDGIRHAYGEKVVLEAVSFSLEAGQALAVTGSNGSGKSTLLRCLVAAEKAAAGSVWIGDRALEETDPVVRSVVATVFDDIDFFPDLTVAEHLDLLARAHGVASVEDSVDTVLYELGLDRASDQFPSTLSSGQRHRLALATALVRPRRLLLLDEPEQRLDDAGRAWLAGRLNAEKAAGVTIVFASHSRELVEAVADSELSLEAL